MPSYLHRRRNPGSSAVELVCGLMILVPMALSAVDLATVFLGGLMNAEAARNGARAAASGAPKQLDFYGPVRRAKQVIKQVNGRRHSPIRITRVRIRENIRALPDALYGGPVVGTVTATTDTVIAPPFLISHFIPDGCFTLTAEATFPYTWVRPAQYNVVPSPVEPDLIYWPTPPVGPPAGGGPPGGGGGIAHPG